MVPLAGIEPALLAETDFESVASTNSATGAASAAERMCRIARRGSTAGVQAVSTGGLLSVPPPTRGSGVTLSAVIRLRCLRTTSKRKP